LKTFNELNLNEKLLRALKAEGYTVPTPIQSQAIPELMAGGDLLGIAQTGTGKTAAFALPILERLLRDPKPTPRRSCRALILSPTRELAGQIHESFRSYGRFAKLSSDVAYGGVPIGRQMRALNNGVDILVATPGRLLDLVNQRAVQLSDVEVLVLDEADHMLDLGFILNIRKLVAMTSIKRQTMLFSATMPKDIAELAAAFLRNPARVEVTPVATTAERVEQKIIFVDTMHKQNLLYKLMDDATIDRALVFTRTKHGADKVVKRLEEKGIRAGAIHGNKSQPQRERALADFKAGKLRLLIATDIAARGIDVDNVSHVINFDLPNMPESYVHRIGRTARAGATGIAISFCDREEHSFLRAIEKVTRQQIPVVENPLGPGLGMPPQARVKGAPSPDKPRTTRSGKPVWQRNRPERNRTEAPRPAAEAGRPQRKEGVEARDMAREGKVQRNRRFGR
jgi:ATP-dependent RNA helicase RhlE